MVVEIAKFPMMITKVTIATNNVNGIYSGEGVISLPMGGKKLKVSFTNIGINSVKKVFSGVVEGIKDNPANYTSVQTLIANSNSISTSKVFCNKNPQNDAFDQNGIHKGTGLPWDQNGFGPNGQYVKAPPYDGYIKGDPYDPNYNPQGFDSNGKFKDGSLYNTFGCDVNGKKKDGSACDTVPPPYYWLNNGGSPSGIALANLVGDSLKPFIQQGLRKLLSENNINLIKQKAICGTLRSAVRLHNNTLQYDSLFTFGDNSKWINVGMNKYFKSQPEILTINVVRNSSQDLLENKHKELYACDVLEYKLVEYKDIISLLSSSIDPLVTEFRNRIKNMLPSEADKMMPNNSLNKVNFKAWLNEKLYDKVEAEFKLKNKTVDIEKGLKKMKLQPN